MSELLASLPAFCGACCLSLFGGVGELLYPQQH